MAKVEISAAARSRATREALKTALAMVLTYWIALQANWDKPMWAGLAVALVSLNTLGLSLNKGALRMLGTAVAAIVALVLVGLFPQDRWLFMTALSVWVGCCTYLMLGSGRPYFWQVCGFVSVIICVSTATSHGSAFETAVLRTQQTGLGVFVYSLVAMLLWPIHSDEQFLAAIAQLHEKQLVLYRATIAARQSSADGTQISAGLGDLANAHRNVSSLFDAAVADSYGIWEERKYWQRYVDRCKAVTVCLERLALLAPGSALQQLSTVIPAVGDFDHVIQQRFRSLATPRGTRSRENRQQPPELVVTRAQLESLSLFDAGNLAVIRRQLKSLDSLTNELLSTGTPSTDDSVPMAKPVARNAGSDIGAVIADLIARHWYLDPDRLLAAMRVMLAVWASYLLYIYVEGIPLGATLVTLTGSAAVGLAAVPQVAPLRLVLPLILVTLVAGAIYLFVLPWLYDFWQLALLWFALTFGICRVFSSPASQAAKAIALPILISVCNLQNTQAYSFMGVANMTLAFPIVMLLLALAAYFPASPRPERVFRRFLVRFFRSAGRMFQNSDGVRGGRDKRRLEHALTTLPVKIATWSARVPACYLPDGDRGALDTLVQRIGALAFFMQALANDRPDNWREPEVLRMWRVSVGSALHAIADSLTGSEALDYRDLSFQLHRLLDSMDSEVRRDAERFSQLGGEAIERWLGRAGLLRGVAQSLVDVAQAADKFSWRKWDESRFF